MATNTPIRRGRRDRSVIFFRPNPAAVLALPFPFPTTGVLDDFNAGAAQLLTARAGWNNVILETGTNSFKTDAVPTVAQNNLAGQHGSNSWATQAQDTEVWMDFGTYVNTQTQLYLRLSTTNIATATGYQLDYVTSGTWSINRWNSGAAVNVATKVGGPVLGSGDSIGFAMRGTTIAAFYKPAAGIWQVVVQGTDATYAAAGYFGMELVATTPVNNIDRVGGGTVVLPAGRSEIVVKRLVRSGR